MRAALSGISNCSSGGGDGNPVSSVSTGGRRDVCLGGYSPCLLLDFVLVGGGGAPKMKFENAAPRPCAGSRCLSSSGSSDLSTSSSGSRGLECLVDLDLPIPDGDCSLLLCFSSL